MIKRIIARFVLAAYLKVGLFDMTLVGKTSGVYLAGRELYRGHYLRGMKLYQVLDDFDTNKAKYIKELKWFGLTFYIYEMEVLEYEKL